MMRQWTSPVSTSRSPLDISYVDSPYDQSLRDFTAGSPPNQLSKIHPLMRYLAVSAQVVYIGSSANLPMVARVSITDYRGNVVLDTLVRPTQPVTDYRQPVTGLMPIHLADAPHFNDVQHQVATLIQGSIIVGYCLWQFLSVLGIPHPAADTRDVAVFLPFRRSLRCKQLLPLQVLVNRLMGRNVGVGYEHPLENARATLDLFRSCQQFWEGIIDSGSWPCTLPPVAYANCFT